MDITNIPGGILPPASVVWSSISEKSENLSRSIFDMISKSILLCLNVYRPSLRETWQDERIWLRVSFQPHFLHLSELLNPHSFKFAFVGRVSIDELIRTLLCPLGVRRGSFSMLHPLPFPPVDTEACLA